MSTQSALPGSHFSYRNGELFCENISVKMLARRYGTPLYVYSQAEILQALAKYENSLKDWPHFICYAVKANSNFSILQLLAQHGCGFDIVSGGELLKVKAAGADMGKVTYSGVGKTEEEIRLALRSEIKSFNVESASELNRLSRLAAQVSKQARISIRINPDVNAHTHPYISTGLKENKFGVSPQVAFSLYRQAKEDPWLCPIGIDCHIGSQLTEISPYIQACETVVNLLDRLTREGIYLEHIDFGGGVGVRYRDEPVIDLAALTKELHTILAQRGYGHLSMIFEPGRSIVASSGLLIGQVQYIKTTETKNFLISDTAMTEMIRPALYQAWMPILEVSAKPQLQEKLYDIVGPVCESSDWLGKQRALKIAEGDYFAVAMAGAYGMSMASTYNCRNLPAEILVDRDRYRQIRRRLPVEDQWAAEMPETITEKALG